MKEKREEKNFGLNQQQFDAVTAGLGPVLILAGAGSGKTRALTMRIIYLIKKMGFSPENLLAVTFTNKAAGEMKERIIKLLEIPRKNSSPQLRNSNLPAMGTFHSIGSKIVRAHAPLLGLDKNFVIYDDDDQENVIKEILIQLRIDPTKFKPSLFGHIIDRAKNNLEEPEDLDASDNPEFSSMARKVYELYQEQLRKNNAVDFGDLIVLPVRLFKQHPEILEYYQKLWKYILVDEYQDTNQAQYMMTKLLASGHHNLFVVGDDAQAIYGFRGADLQNILDFEKDYPEAKIYRLEQNYRSTQQILSIAEKVIKLSPRQHKKELWTDNDTGVTPVLYRADDELAEAWFVAKTIVELQDKPASNEPRYENEYDDLSAEASAEADERQQEGILSRIMKLSRTKVVPRLQNREGLNNIAVLYRMHAQSRSLEEMLIEAGIPYQIVGGLKFYERREIKDIIAYLRLLINPNDLISLKRIINVPPRGIGPKSFEQLKEVLLSSQQDHAELVSASFRNDPETSSGWTGSKLSILSKPQVANFFGILDTIRNLDPNETNILDVLRNLIRLTGYENFLRDGSEEGESRFENIQELFNVAGIYKALPWKEGLSQFLEEVSLMTQADEVDLNSPKITLMTLHQAKGLEFDTVFLVGLEEGILPHSRSMLESKDIAEEVRLAYVGVTRARKRLYLVHALSRKTYGVRNMSVPSRILKAIPEELLDIIEYHYD